MRLQHARVSRGLTFFKDAFLSNYKLKECTNKMQPCVMFGMYRGDDYDFYLKHQAPILVVWCGSDSMAPRLTPLRRKIILSKPHKHIATHDHGSADLKAAGIPHEVIPVTPAKIEFEHEPRGDNVYFYSTGPDGYRDRMYGRRFLPEIKKRIGKINIIEADQQTYNRQELREVYKSCFLALRLTGHDGVPTTVLEMGIMGRKSVFNGSVPHCMHWNGVEDIAQTILKEYETRKQDNKYISEDIRKYLDIGYSWLIV